MEEEEQCCATEVQSYNAGRDLSCRRSSRPLAKFRLHRIAVSRASCPHASVTFSASLCLSACVSRAWLCILAWLCIGCAFSRSLPCILSCILSFPALPLPLTLLRSRPFMKNLLLLSTVHESFVSPLLSPSLLRAPVATRRPVPHQRPAPLPPTSHFWRPAVKQIWG